MAIQTKTMTVKSDTALAETTTTIRDTMTFDVSKMPNGITYKGLKAVLSFADPIQWNKASTYDSLTVVWNDATHASYASKRPVPQNIEITNEFYWFRTADTTSTSRSTSDDRNVFQDTPMNGLDTGAIEAMDYATNVTLDHGTTENGSSAKNETSGSSTDAYTGDFDGTKVHNQKGYDTNQSELLLTYRKTLLNIDLEIVDRLSTLFMGLW